jgi:hypothetical protein
MPCELLICNFNKGLWNRGYAVAVKDVPCEWGAKEGLPNWIILRITDATKDQVEQYMGTWPGNMFTYTVQAQNEQGYRVKFEIDPAYVNAVGLGGEIKKEVRDYLVESHQAVLVEYDWNYAVFDIPKPVVLAEVRLGLKLTFSAYVALRRYYFSSADMDYAVAQGGVIEFTAAQAQNRVIDNLA